MDQPRDRPQAWAGAQHRRQVAQTLLQGGRRRSARPQAARPPCAFPAAVVAPATGLACEVPATRGVPLGRWSLAELRTEVLATGLVDDVSTTTLWRWLAEDPIKPRQHRSWIFPPDPDFAAQAAVVLDLYQRVFA